MKIIIITPAKKQTIGGNRTSAERWAELLRQLDHDVSIEVEYNQQSADLMIALHARHSAKAIEQYKNKYPSLPLVVALGGTDVNLFLKSEPDITLAAIERADALVCLHNLVYKRLPLAVHDKLTVIFQSAIPLAQERVPRPEHFDICVVGNLRQVKDPFRAALASGHLSEKSRIRIFHFGKEQDQNWKTEAQRLEELYSRYHWKGQVDHDRVRKEFSRTRLMVISSLEEGGANVVSEALVAGVPIIASDIEGNIGMLGPDYKGYFSVGDEFSLAKRLELAENDAAFYGELERQCLELAPQFTPNIERSAWAKLIRSLKSSAAS